MDVLAHGLWTNAAFFKKYLIHRKNRYLAVLFGILPDIVSFAPALTFLFITRQNFSPALFNSKLWVFRWAAESYNYTHSLVVFMLVMLIVVAVRKGKFYWPLAAWGLHVLIDIPTHKNFYETPFLFPITNYHFRYGLSWAAPVFMIVNYGALAAVYGFWFFVLRKRNAKEA